MQRPLLRKPILPRPAELTAGTTWKQVWDAFDNVRKNRLSLVQFLQSYLTSVYNQVIPANFIVSIVTADLSPYQIIPALGDNDPAHTGVESFVAASADAATPTIIILPPASGSGRIIVVKKMDANAQPITVQPSAGDLIDGGPSTNITLQYDAVRFVDGAAGQWMIW